MSPSLSPYSPMVLDLANSPDRPLSARVLCAEPCPARRSHALDSPLWVPVRLSSKEKGSLSDSHPP